MEFDNKSAVYVKVDDQGRVVQCEGGYTETNIALDVANGEKESDWIKIDEGVGDKYNLCQSLYFDALYTDDGIPRWKCEDGACVLRTVEDVEADRAGLPAAAPSQLDRIEAQVTYTAMMTDTLMEV